MVVSDGFILFNVRFVVEDVKYVVGSEDLFIGMFKIVDGKLVKENFEVSGKLLVYLVVFIIIVFICGFFGDFG